ncbi:MAG: hypothetical protein E4H14_16960 [Candidatus Thorarchaeota archaeon]|nr:MAG: hypothetical protein E4H14_16960 [Candidatus Thorarchaeota archaeon]
MTDSPQSSSEIRRVRIRLSKIRFPEQCPVCMGPAEDLVFITIIESHGLDSFDSSSWKKGNDKTAIAIQSAKSTTTFPVPTCMAHGSKSVRTIRTRLVTVLGFFLLFYPIVFYLLQINLALIYSRSLVGPVLGAALFVFILVVTIFYGLFPRALERGLKFENTSTTKDSVDVVIKNRDYRQRFIQMNAMFAEPVSDD